VRATVNKQPQARHEGDRIGEGPTLSDGTDNVAYSALLLVDDHGPRWLTAIAAHRLDTSNHNNSDKQEEAA